MRASSAGYGCQYKEAYVFTLTKDMDYELDAFEQALKNPSASAALNEWLDASIDKKLAALDAKWEERFVRLDAKWEERFGRLEAKWEERFARLEAKLDDKTDDVRFLKAQNAAQAEQLLALQSQINAKNDQIIALLRETRQSA